MTTSAERQQSPRARGSFLATNLANRVQVGQEQYTVSDNDKGHLLDLATVPFGGGRRQDASWQFDHDWNPLHLTVEVEGHSTTDVSFTMSECVVVTKSAESEVSQRFEVGRERAFFLLNGALSSPIVLARRFDWSQDATQSFALIPPGFLDVRRLPDDEVGGKCFRVLEVRISTMGLQDTVTMFIDERGDIARYQTKNFQTLVELEEENNAGYDR